MSCIFLNSSVFLIFYTYFKYSLKRLQGVQEILCLIPRIFSSWPPLPRQHCTGLLLVEKMSNFENFEDLLQQYVVKGWDAGDWKKSQFFWTSPPPVCPYVFFYFISCDVKIQEENSAVSAYSLAVFSSVISGFNYYYCWEIDKLKIFYQLVVDFTGFASL